jgi:hypothetical protein
MMSRRFTFLALVCCCSCAYTAGARAASPEFFPQPLPTGGQLRDPTLSADTVAQEAREHADRDALARNADELRDALTRRLQMLADELAAEGFRSERLIDQLAPLAALYQERGDHLLAVGALDWALQLNRIHNGLYSLEDAALLDPMIASVTALEDYETARSLEQRLIELTFRNPDDPRVTVILAASADRRLREAQRILEGESAAQGFLAVGMASASTPVEQPAQVRRREALMSLWAARRQYAQAIAAGVRNGGYAVIDLLQLEEQLLSTFFLEMSHPALAPEQGVDGRLCAQGEAVIENSVGNVSRFRESPTAAAGTLIKLADWRLLCSRNGQALDTYDSAYATLLDRGAAGEVVAQLLSPQIPADIPAAFRGFSTDGEEPPAYRGYVDVSFVVGKYGTARNIDILGMSPGTSRAVARDLRGHIAGNRFRPRFVDGESVRADRIEVRYYYR